AYLIAGQLGVQIGFERYELFPGDSISFDASSPHRLWTIGDRPAEAIWSSSADRATAGTAPRQGDDVRTRARSWYAEPRVEGPQRMGGSIPRSTLTSSDQPQPSI